MNPRPGGFDPGEPWALAGGRLLTGLAEVADHPAALDRPGHWAVVASFEGRITAARFTQRRRPDLLLDAADRWPGFGRDPHAWASTLDRAAYIDGVETIRSAIAAGEVYQVNLCRVLYRPWPQPMAVGPGLAGLALALRSGNPAPYAAAVHLPEQGLAVASASPELFLDRDGPEVRSAPIKGTAASPAELTAKDRAENVMIVDLVRNDLARVCAPGSVTVPSLLAVEQHPGLVHLVSTVCGGLADGTGWPELLAATLPPGSVSGAPKLAALDMIRRLEPAPRGSYCGAIGWVDGARRTGRLAVGIRTFEVADGMLRLGTGAGITWHSDAEAEWEETELKTRRLLQVVGGT